MGDHVVLGRQRVSEHARVADKWVPLVVAGFELRAGPTASVAATETRPALVYNAGATGVVVARGPDLSTGPLGRLVEDCDDSRVNDAPGRERRGDPAQSGMLVGDIGRGGQHSAGLGAPDTPVSRLKDDNEWLGGVAGPPSDQLYGASPGTPAGGRPEGGAPEWRLPWHARHLMPLSSK